VKRFRLGLFGRTALALITPFLLVQSALVAVFVVQVNLPLARSATEDLAALIVLVAQTWAELPPDTRADYQNELRVNHHLLLEPARGPQPGLETHLPYPALLQKALAERIGVESHLTRSSDPEMYWVDLPTPEAVLRIGFSHDRIGAYPLRVLVVAVAAVVLASLLTAMLLARWLTRPLARMSRATAAVGHGELPQPLPESGPRELQLLARRFNQMACDVRQLLDSRTTLLAGVSHDLRTPLARLRLSLAMLPESVDSTLVADIERDVESMDRLIGQHLSFARGAVPEAPQPCDLGEIIGAAVADMRRQGAQVHWRTPDECIRAVPVLALRRVLSNLLDNAWRHGQGSPVEVRLDCAPTQAVVRILDRGPGIAEDERERVFEPFQRARQARAPGSGLGLAIVRQLAQANGWTVSLHARDGGGAEARFAMPTSA
jgi:two-component system osmolarity sensor histidine kinase EnvZ